jgi:hypothetical protein
MRPTWIGVHERGPAWSLSARRRADADIPGGMTSNQSSLRRCSDIVTVLSLVNKASVGQLSSQERSRGACHAYINSRIFLDFTTFSFSLALISDPLKLEFAAADIKRQASSCSHCQTVTVILERQQ